MTITKRNGKFYCRFQIDGERHHFLCQGATTIKEAEKLESQFKFKLQQQINGVIPKDVKKITMNKLFDIFLQYSETNKKSYKQDKSRVALMRQYFANKTYITDIKPEDIEKFKMYLITEDRSKTTVNRYLELLSKMFNIAIDNEWLTKNPVKKDNKFPIKNYTVRYLKDNEEIRIFKACPEFFKPIIITALNSGLRKGNIRILTWENVNLDDRILDITENKGNKHIKIYMNDELYELFKNLPKTHPKYVFTNPKTGKPYSNTAMKRIWDKIKEDAHVTNFRFHDLRHTVGTRLARANVPIPVIRELLAHSDVETTMRYIHTVSKEMESAMNVLSSKH